MTADMAIDRDPGTGAIYCAFGRGRVAGTHHLSDLVLVDVGARNDIVGIEFAGDVDRLPDEDWRAVLDALPDQAGQLATLR